MDDIDPNAEDADRYIYMVKRSDNKSSNKYDEYMVIEKAVERVGDWEVDLSNYVTVTEVEAVKNVTDKLMANVDTLEVISAERVAAWDAMCTIHVGATQPEDMKNGDLWFQTFVG